MAMWDYPTNFSNGTNVDSLGSLVFYMDYVTNGWAATGLIFIIGVMSLVLSMAVGFGRALLTSGFITGVFVVYFIRLGIINPVMIFISIAAVIAGALATRGEGGRI